VTIIDATENRILLNRIDEARAAYLDHLEISAASRSDIWEIVLDRRETVWLDGLLALNEYRFKLEPTFEALIDASCDPLEELVKDALDCGALKSLDDWNGYVEEGNAGFELFSSPDGQSPFIIKRYEPSNHAAQSFVRRIPGF
jgi:hypothetical protein